MKENPSTEELVTRISEQLKQLESCLNTKNCKLESGIKVPPKTIRTVADLISGYSFVANQTYRRNICYAVEALDLYRWLINRFNLYGPVSAYLYKTGIILINMIIEVIVRDFLLQQNEILAKKHKQNIDKLARHGLDITLISKMHDIRKKREAIHLHLVKDLEAVKYELTDWNNAVISLQEIKDAFHIKVLSH